MSDCEETRVPLVDAPSVPSDDRRLWIGNLDPRITEYHLLKILQKHGNIEKFDLLFHRNGPLSGQPRGYAFITYTKREDAIAALRVLHNQQIGSKRVNVMWAHNMIELDKPKADLNIPALAGGRATKQVNKEMQIQAIEDKLKMMENKLKYSDDFEINKSVSTETPVIAQYQFNKPEVSHSSANRKGSSNYKRMPNNNKPYHRNRKK